jgi:hypothetical protein
MNNEEVMPLCKSACFISRTTPIILKKFGVQGGYTESCQVNLILVFTNQS